MNNISLPALGWNKFFESQLDAITVPDYQVARVIHENKTNYGVRSGGSEYIAEVMGKLLYGAESDAELPKVGDWVVTTLMDDRRAIIHQVLNRQSILSRKVAGKRTAEQIIAVNLDVVFIVQGLDDNFNIARLERYLTAMRDIRPVVVLNKSDLCSNLPAVIAEVRTRIPGIDVIATSTLNDSIGELKARITPATTFAFVGSSGVGKSSLINGLLNSEVLKTSAVRKKDSRGKHTTTRREMIFLENGGIIIDTPGMREFQPWDADDNIDSVFSDITELAQGCRYADCQHTHEEDCAVKSAVESGLVSAKHYANYLKLRREMDYQASLTDVNKALERKRAARIIIKAHNKVMRKKRRDS